MYFVFGFVRIIQQIYIVYSLLTLKTAILCIKSLLPAVFQLWMGTLATGPSVVKPSGTLLSDYISKNPSCLGETILQRFHEQLPFLFKVLSVNKSLSIQAHPNKVGGLQFIRDGINIVLVGFDVIIVMPQHAR